MNPPGTKNPLLAEGYFRELWLSNSRPEHRYGKQRADVAGAVCGVPPQDLRDRRKFCWRAPSRAPSGQARETPGRRREQPRATDNVQPEDNAPLRLVGIRVRSYALVPIFSLSAMLTRSPRARPGCGALSFSPTVAPARSCRPSPVAPWPARDQLRRQEAALGTTVWRQSATSAERRGWVTALEILALSRATSVDSSRHNADYPAGP